MLSSLPVAVRDVLPVTSRVLTCLSALDSLDTAGLDLNSADHLKLDRLAHTRQAIASITGQLRELDRQIPALLKDLGSTLTDITGVGVVTAMTLVTEVGDPNRFTTEAKFARWCGAAPLPASSGEGHQPPHRHRLDLGGNRQANSVLHMIHVTQGRMYEPARVYLARQRERGKTVREARRCHKRQLANVLIRHMWNDAATDPAASPFPTP